MKCEMCNNTGWYGDNGPGIAGNREYNRCECGQVGKLGTLGNRLLCAHDEILQICKKYNVDIEPLYDDVGGVQLVASDGQESQYMDLET
jgi:hypothetical protein